MKAKKIYLKDIDTEKQVYLIKHNKKLMQQLQNDLYNSNMEMQYIDSRNIMNDTALRAIQYHDNYSSFFYTLLDWRKFIQNIDTAYLDDATQKEAKKVFEIIKTIDSLDYSNEEECKKIDLLEEEAEKITKNVLENVENYLHEYEEYPDEDDAIEYALEMDWLDDLYIEERADGSSDNVIRKDIAYTETYI